ncbi:MAG: DUF6702 family protein [Candidatus Kapaibacterium sp.]
MKKYLIISVLLALSQSAIAHDIHISYAQAELKGNELHIKVSYYKDDFTKAVKNWYQGRADNFTTDEFQSAEFEYVKNYFRVCANGDYKNFISPKLEKCADDGTSIIFELDYSCDSFHSIIIDQRVLFKEYSDQMNIFFIKAFGKEENHIFTPGKPTVIIKP